MIWIALITVVTLYVLYFMFRFAATIQGVILKTDTKSAFGFISDYPKSCIIAALMVMGLSLSQYYNHIYAMYDCTVQQKIHKAANSEYSWYNAECNFQDKNGVFINMKRVRGLPEGTNEQVEE